MLVEIIKPRLAQGYDLWMLGKFHQFARDNAVFLVGLMRMGADRAIDVRKSLGDPKQRAELLHTRRDRDDAPNAGGLGARDDGVEILGEVREIEMAVAVDEHCFRTVQSAFN